jgi:hypothetical protein
MVVGGRGGSVVGADSDGASTPQSQPQRRQIYRLLERGARVFW